MHGITVSETPSTGSANTQPSSSSQRSILDSISAPDVPVCIVSPIGAAKNFSKAASRCIESTTSVLRLT